MDNETPLQRFLRAYLASKLAVFGLALLAIVLFAAIAGPFLAPQNPYDLKVLDVMDSRLPPGEKSGDGKLTFLLGSDEQGRDMLSAILYGLRTSVLVGVVSTAIALLIGLSLGLWSAYLGGRFDALVMRLVDIQLSFPPILIALILLALTGPGLGKIIVALVTVKWATTPGPHGPWPWWSATRNTWKPPPAWACRPDASSSDTCCPIA